MSRGMSSVRIERVNRLLSRVGSKRSGRTVPSDVLIRECEYGGESKSREASIRLLQRDIQFLRVYFSVKIIYVQKEKGYVLL